jgi:hypothetical protein
MLWLASALAGCGDDEAHGRGELVVVLESDLSAPKDIDRIRLELTQRGKVLRTEDHEIGAGQQLLPAEFRIESVESSAPVTVRGIAYRKMVPRIERDAVTPIPAGSVMVLRLPFNYLCDGFVTSDGSSTCEEGMTCKQGDCASSTVSASELPEHDVAAETGTMTSSVRSIGGESGGESSPSDQPDEACFDVLECFVNFVIVGAAEDCTIPMPAGAEPEELNIALALPPSSDGICDAEGCWVALDHGGEGWLNGGSKIQLPESVCRARPDAVPMAIALSSTCAAKTSATPPCGSWSSAAKPIESRLPTSLPPPALGDACAGRPSETCGNCGTRARNCRNGKWSEWSACSGEGVCVPNTAQVCGEQGSQTCDATCAWAECTGQSCGDDVATRACGNCGTQARACDNGTWSEWGACSGAGECAPSDVQACGAEGSQACGGNCAFGECTNQVCPGANSDACERCGSRTRSCDPATGNWSDWSACTGQGACEPNATERCGNGGTRVCGGDCRWDTQCTGQSCDGPLTRACGQCGIQVRGCDSNTGRTTDWLACANEGSCEPGATRACGNTGLQTCGRDCRWGSDCDQICEGPFTQACGACGTRTRGCDLDARTETAWSECRGVGACAAGTTRPCGADGSGTQACGDDCQWSDACSCSADTLRMRPCGNCGIQTRSCGAAGPSVWSACMNEGLCAPGTPRACGEALSGTQACSADCRWTDDCAGACPADSRAEPRMRACGNCGHQTRTCAAGGLSAWSECIDGGECAPGTTQACGDAGVGMRTCTATCSWARECEIICEPQQRACGNCGMQTGTCSASGQLVWSECVGEGVCARGSMQSCPTLDSPGVQTCGDTCGWGECGCTAPCANGTTCVNGRCECPPGTTPAPEGGSGCVSPPICHDDESVCASKCVNLRTDSNNCGDCGVPCSGGQTCQDGKCLCPSGRVESDGVCVCADSLTACGESCVDTQTDANNCGACATACEGGTTCQKGVCACPGGSSDDGTCGGSEPN